MTVRIEEMILEEEKGLHVQRGMVRAASNRRPLDFDSCLQDTLLDLIDPLGRPQTGFLV